MKGMNYKGYFAKVEFDAEDHIFVGLIIDIHDVLASMVNQIQNLKHLSMMPLIIKIRSLKQLPFAPYLVHCTCGR